MHAPAPVHFVLGFCLSFRTCFSSGDWTPASRVGVSASVTGEISVDEGALKQGHFLVSSASLANHQCSIYRRLLWYAHGYILGV
jgi:hypothetical protein